MSMPVIIPSRDGVQFISGTLNRLPAECAPIVVVNGIEDGTSSIAARFGADVLYIEQEGKMPAIQHGLALLGRAAIEPLVILDVDTRPVFPKTWLKTYSSMLSSPEPTVIGAPVIFTSRDIATCGLRSIRRLQHAYQSPTRITETNQYGRLEGHQFGPNMGLRIQDTKILDAILTLPNYWPGEDEAIGKQIVIGDGVYYESAKLGLLAVTPASDRFASFRESLLLKISGRPASINGVAMWAKYRDTAPARSVINPDLLIHSSPDTSAILHD